MRSDLVCRREGTSDPYIYGFPRMWALWPRPRIPPCCLTCVRPRSDATALYCVITRSLLTKIPVDSPSRASVD